METPEVLGQGVPVELFACLCRAEMSRGAIEQANAERRFQLLDAVTQRGLGHAETSTCCCEAAPVDDLHEVEKVIQVEHRSHPVGGAFVPSDNRNLPDRRFVDMNYPARWWRREDGVNQRFLRAYFGHVL
jgi:hypothetical protein